MSGFPCSFCTRGLTAKLVDVAESGSGVPRGIRACAPCRRERGLASIEEPGPVRPHGRIRRDTGG